MKKYSIVFVSAEASPFVKVGGLADVVGALPLALHKLGQDVRLILPGYTIIDWSQYDTKYVGSFVVHTMGQQFTAEAVKLNWKGIEVYFIKNERYFRRGAIYGEQDDLERFAFFNFSAVELLKLMNWKTDIIHCHDWHAALVNSMLKVWYRNHHLLSHPALVFTIHNLGYQGWFDEHFVRITWLQDLMPPTGNKFRKFAYSTMGLAIYHSDAISTVSKTYSREILTPELGYGLETLLQYRKADIYGIVNGIDYDEFNPDTDRCIAVNYDIDSLEKKKLNKRALQKAMGLPEREDIPIIGMVGRLVEQKGVDITLEAMAEILPRGRFQFAVLGSGHEQLELSLRNLTEREKGRMSVSLGYNRDLGQLIYAGSDIYLMPSRYEPCGLGQLIAQRYGTVPIVRQTGGLADTVEDCSNDLTEGTGFVFEKYDSNALIETIFRAIEAYEREDKWRVIIRRCMTKDFSWEASAMEYLDMYDKALQNHRLRI